MKNKIVFCFIAIILVGIATFSFYTLSKNSVGQGYLTNIKQMTPWAKYGDDVEPHKSAVFCGEFNYETGKEEYCWVVTYD